MTREIKFKSWLPGIKKMTYPHTLDELMNWDTKTEDNGTAIWLQYTGLKDKNGKEMYEGDVVRFKDNWPGADPMLPPKVGIVGFSDASFRIERTTSSYYRWMDFECEVIGNKYENPEILAVMES